MEAEAVCDVNDKDKMDLDNMHPMQPDARDCSSSEITLGVSCDCPLKWATPADRFYESASD